MARTTDHDWIAARLARTTPPWAPDPLRARQALDRARTARTRRASRPLRLAAAGAVALIAAAFVVPPGRAMAQELWYRLFASRFQVVRLDMSKVPFDTSLSITGGERSAASVAEASAMAGYRVELPPADLLKSEPVLTVLPPMGLTQRIDRNRILAALAAQGADDVEVPAEWDGVALRGTVGRTVAARYPGSAATGPRRDDVTILQTPPIRLELPAGFPLDRFAEALFRAGGLSWWDARTLGQEYAAHPAWLLDVPGGGGITVETVPFGDGTAVVVEEAQGGGITEITVFVSRPQRLYAVSSLSRETSLRVAGALP